MPFPRITRLIILATFFASTNELTTGQEVELISETGESLRALAITPNLVIVDRRGLQTGREWRISQEQEITHIEEDNLVAGLVLARLSAPQAADELVDLPGLPPMEELTLDSRSSGSGRREWVPGFGFTVQTNLAGRVPGPVLNGSGVPVGFLLVETDGSATVVPIRSVEPTQGPRSRWDEWRDRWPDFPALDDLASFYRKGRLEACLALGQTIAGDEAGLLVALSQARNGSLQEAARALGEIVTRDPAHAYAMAPLAAIYQAAGYEIQALNLSRKALQFRRRVPYAHSILAARQLLDEQFEDSVKSFDAWIDNGVPGPDQAFAYFGRGTALLRLDRESEALSALRASERSPVIAPTDRIAPRFWTPESLQDPRDLAIARALGGLGRWKEAIRYFETAFNRTPSLATPELLVEVGEAYSRLGRWEQARDRFRSATELDSDSAKANHWLGVSLGWANRWTEASAALARSVELSPDNAESNYMLGVAWVNLGDTEKASRQVDRLRVLGSEMAGQLKQLLDSKRP